MTSLRISFTTSMSMLWDGPLGEDVLNISFEMTCPGSNRTLDGRVGVGRDVGGEREVQGGKRSKRNSHSSIISCLDGRSPGFFSEKSREERPENGDGKDDRRACLPISEVDRALMQRRSS